MIKVTITCEDYWVADSLFNLGSQIESTDILDAVYEDNEAKEINDGHFKAVIEKVEQW